MVIQEAYQQLLFKLFKIYDQRESAIICDWVIEYVTGVKKIERVLNKNFLVSEEQKILLLAFTNELMQYKPVQYVLHEAWFSGMKLYIDENVLIPRPETEELVEWIMSELPAFSHQPSAINNPSLLLDIGTGSGCIPIALKKKFPTVVIHALDISAGALNVAKRNANEQQTEIHFHQLDILNTGKWSMLPQFEIIVSNPPYIKKSEAAEMQKNVLLHEPSTALFVPDDDGMLFYKVIASFGIQHLKPGGKLFFEINEAHGKDVCSLLEAAGYLSIELKKDMQQKDRMVRAIFFPKA